MTRTTKRLLRVFLEAGARERHYGFQLGRSARLPSGTLYPILRRLEAEGWLVSDWEELDPSEAGRPPRCYYKLTGLGLREASTVIELGKAGEIVAIPVGEPA